MGLISGASQNRRREGKGEGGGGGGVDGALGCKGAIAHIHVSTKGHNYVSSCAHPEAIVRILVSTS